MSTTLNNARMSSLRDKIRSEAEKKEKVVKTESTTAKASKKKKK